MWKFKLIIPWPILFKLVNKKQEMTSQPSSSTEDPLCSEHIYCTYIHRIIWVCLMNFNKVS